MDLMTCPNCGGHEISHIRAGINQAYHHEIQPCNTQVNDLWAYMWRAFHVLGGDEWMRSVPGVIAHAMQSMGWGTDNRYYRPARAGFAYDLISDWVKCWPISNHEKEVAADVLTRLLYEATKGSHVNKTYCVDPEDIEQILGQSITDVDVTQPSMPVIQDTATEIGGNPCPTLGDQTEDSVISDWCASDVAQFYGGMSDYIQHQLKSQEPVLPMSNFGQNLNPCGEIDIHGNAVDHYWTPKKTPVEAESIDITKQLIQDLYENNLVSYDTFFKAISRFSDQDQSAESDQPEPVPDPVQRLNRRGRRRITK